MSEYQYVAFRAIDGPVSAKNLEYMHLQSSRAEITPWSFDSEYNYSDFRGNAVEMLRRGYDLQLHYANFGIRRLLIRLPHGPPDSAAAKPYFTKHGLEFAKDQRGPGGILRIEPFHEPGDLEDLHDFEDLLNRLLPIRAEILDGDLEPLYLASLVMACDANHDPNETEEPPVPAGLDKLTDSQYALMQLYSLSSSLVAAAANGSPPLPKRDDPQNSHAQWLEGQSPASKNTWLAEMMSDSHSTVRSKILAEFRQSQKSTTWPTVRLDRTLAALQAAAVEIKHEANRKSAQKAARQKAKRMADMAADPGTTLLETEQLVKQRTSTAYSQIGKLLAELRESLAGTPQAGLAAEQAKKLKAKNPTRHTLVSELRRQGFLAK